MSEKKPARTREARRTTSVRMAAVRDVSDRRERFLMREALGYAREVQAAGSGEAFDEAMRRALTEAWSDGAVHAANLEQQLDAAQAMIGRLNDELDAVTADRDALKSQLRGILRARSRARGE